MYRLHIGSKHISSWSLRPWLLMKACGIPFEEVLHHFIDDKEAQRAQWRPFSPTSQVPALHDGGTVVWDSLAIAEYLAERHPHIWPQDAEARAWARSAAAEMHSGFAVMRTVCNFTLLRADTPAITPGLRRNLERIDALWNEGLGRFGGDFLAAEHFGAVDAFYAPVALRLANHGLEDALSGAAKAYAQRLLALPAMKEWLSDGLKEIETARQE